MKLVGLSLLFFAAVLAGFFAAARRQKISEKRHGALELVRQLSFQLKHFDRDAAELFAALDCPSLKEFLSVLQGEGEADPVGAAGRAVASFEPVPFFGPKEWESICGSAQRFGSLSMERQTKDLELLSTTLAECVARDEKSLAADVKLYRLLGIVAGLGILIFLI